MKRLTVYLVTICLISASLAAQPSEGSSSSFVCFPAGLHFTPLKANLQEARIGVFKYLETSEMKVDVGNTIDVLGLHLDSSNIMITLGIDFMAYALTTNTHGLRLQIDALDGLFGGNLTCSKRLEHTLWSSRLRLLHHSAHFVDGHYDPRAKTWLDDRNPIPYTRDFGELLISNLTQLSACNVRPYAGISYATLVRPAVVQRFSYLTGFEIFTDQIAGSVAGHPMNLYVAYQLGLTGTPEYQATHQIQTGVKLGRWERKGVVLYLAYYSGRYMFAEYFDRNISVLGAGFSVDFF